LGIINQEPLAMPKYKKVDVSEQQLEDLIRQSSDLIEEGLVFVDHQKQAAGGRLDVLFVDSGRSLVVAELKVIEDDGMLFQCLDYYDHVAARIETYARLYSSHNVDPTQPVRLLLVAPSFSQTLINRCKWIDAPISLFTYSCIKLEKSDDIIPVFSEQAIPSPPDTVVVHKLDDHLSYITDAEVRANVSKVLDQIKQLKPGHISMDALKYAISMKVDGRVFAYLHPRRKHYVISTYNAEEKWTDYSIKSDDDLNTVLQFITTSVERQSK
jgi:predicted DNA-binding protein (MmcQ/YjbR family)